MSIEEMKEVDIRTVESEKLVDVRETSRGKNLSREEIDRAARINMEVCAAFVARMIQKYGQEVLAELEEIKAQESQCEM